MVVEIDAPFGTLFERAAVSPRSRRPIRLLAAGAVVAVLVFAVGHGCLVGRVWCRGPANVDSKSLGVGQSGSIDERLADPRRRWNGRRARGQTGRSGTESRCGRPSRSPSAGSVGCGHKG